VTDAGLAAIAVLRSLKTLVVGAEESLATEWLLGGKGALLAASTLNVNVDIFVRWTG
jgi:hypothetical protein